MFNMLHRNPALAMGIFLPILLVLLFTIAALVPKYTVDAPSYDLLFSTRSYSPQSQYEYKFTIEGEKLKLQARKLTSSDGYGGYSYKLYWYKAAEDTVQEIPLPDKDVKNSWVVLPVKETENWKIYPDLTAPDGYKLYNDYRRTSDLGLLFFSGSQRNAIHITKDNRIISVFPPPTDRNAYTPEFIGWITDKGEAS